MYAEDYGQAHLNAEALLQLQEAGCGTVEANGMAISET